VQQKQQASGSGKKLSFVFYSEENNTTNNDSLPGIDNQIDNQINLSRKKSRKIENPANQKELRFGAILVQT